MRASVPLPSFLGGKAVKNAKNLEKSLKKALKSLAKFFPGDILDDVLRLMSDGLRSPRRRG